MDSTDLKVAEILGDAFAEVRLPDEEGNFAVRVVFLDGVDRTESTHTSLRKALGRAERYRHELAARGYDRHRVHVGVLDSDDPERGELDWDDLDA